MVAVLWIVGIFVYFCAGGFSYTIVQNYSRPRCRWQPSNCDAGCGHSIVAGFSVMLWPFILPGLLGVMFGFRSKRPSRPERRRQVEIAEAKHQVELARIRRMEDEELSRQLEGLK